MSTRSCLLDLDRHFSVLHGASTFCLDDKIRARGGESEAEDEQGNDSFHEGA